MSPERRQLISDALAEARERWPGADLDGNGFSTWAEQEPGGLEQLHLSDLVLAKAAASGSASAIATYEQTFFGGLRAAISGIDSTPSFADEVLQVLRIQLFAGGSRKIMQYTGRGALFSWSRVVATRIALDRKRADRRSVSLEDVDLPETSFDPELAGLKARYRTEFAAAVRAAIGELKPEERALLKLHLIDGLELQAIGAAQQVHRTTISRRMREIRSRIRLQTRAHLVAKLGLKDKAELDSVFRLISSQLDVSLSTQLAAPEEHAIEET